MYLGFFLSDKTQLKKFKTCYNNTQVLVENEVIEYKGLSFTINKTDFKKILKQKKSTKPESYLEDSFNKVTSRKFNSSLYFSITKKLENSQNMIATLLKSYIYLKAANPIKAENVLVDVMKKDFLSLIVNSDLQGVELDKQVKLSRYLLRGLKNDFKGSKIIDMFIYYLFTNTTGMYKEMLDDEFSIDSSMSYVRKNYRSITYGKPYIYVWLPFIFEYGSKKELAEQLQYFEVFSEKSLKDASSLLFYRFTEIIETVNKDKVILSFKNIQNSPKVYDKLTYIRLLEDRDFYKYIKANLKIKTGLLLNLKRSFFKDLLKNRRASTFARLSLIEMGDSSLELLPPFKVK